MTTIPQISYELHLDLPPPTQIDLGVAMDNEDFWLPPPWSSVVSLLLFNNIYPTTPTAVTAPGRWKVFQLSTEEAQVDAAELLMRPAPPRGDVFAMLNCLRRAEPGTQYRSFLDHRYNDRPTPTPMLSYWLNHASLTLAREHWQAVRDTLQDEQDSHWDVPFTLPHVLCKMALRTLTVLGWDETLVGKEEGTLTTLHAAELLESGTLSSFVMDGMIHCIRDRLAREPDLNNAIQVHDILPYHLFRFLPVNWQRYHSDPTFTPLRSLASDIRRANSPLRVVFLLWHVEQRWAVFVLDIAARQIRYGDPLGREPHIEDTATIAQWLTKDNLGMWSLGPSLPCEEDVDDLSCGYIVLNAIRLAIFGESFSDKLGTFDLRMCCYLDIVREHVRQIRLYALLSCTHLLLDNVLGKSGLKRCRHRSVRSLGTSLLGMASRGVRATGPGSSWFGGEYQYPLCTVGSYGKDCIRA